MGLFLSSDLFTYFLRIMVVLSGALLIAVLFTSATMLTIVLTNDQASQSRGDAQ